MLGVHPLIHSFDRNKTAQGRSRSAGKNFERGFDVAESTKDVHETLPFAEIVGIGESRGNEARR
jgi:hypothetical protein